MDTLNHDTGNDMRDSEHWNSDRRPKRSKRKATMHQFVYRLGALKLDRWKLNISIHVEAQKER